MRKLFKKPGKALKKQQALFTEALTEAGYPIEQGEIRINHQTGKCYYNSKEFNLIFPLRFLRLSRQLNYSKTYDYCFRGLQTPKRNWVSKYEGNSSKITFTDHGRKIKKDFFDKEYYQEMAHSKFVLCPVGDFNWTYRFFESIMCMSIPIIEKGGDHEQFKHFSYYYGNEIEIGLKVENHEEIAKRNYQLFLKNHTLLNNFIFFKNN